LHEGQVPYQRQAEVVLASLRGVERELESSEPHSLEAEFVGNGKHVRLVHGMVGDHHQGCRTVPLDVELDPSKRGDLDVECKALFVGDCEASISNDDPCGGDRDVSHNALVGTQSLGDWMITIKGISHRVRLRAFGGKDAPTRIAHG
jgi:hypothetical protein